MMTMIVKRFFEPLLAQNSYLIGCAAAGEAIVIDPHRDVQPTSTRRSASSLGSPTSPKRTSTRTSCRERASWRTGRAPGFVSPTKATRTGSTSSRTTAAESRRSDHDRQRRARCPAHAGPHARTSHVPDHRRRRGRRADCRGHRRLHLRRRCRPSRSAREGGEHHGTMEAGREDAVRACRSSSSIRTGCRSGRVTAPDRRAAKASAPFRTARWATSAASTGRSQRKPKTSSSTDVLDGPAGSAEVLRDDEALNKDRSRAARRRRARSRG